jgi:hypothetical protein
MKKCNPLRRSEPPDQAPEAQEGLRALVESGNTNGIEPTATDLTSLLIRMRWARNRGSGSGGHVQGVRGSALSSIRAYSSSGSKC